MWQHMTNRITDDLHTLQITAKLGNPKAPLPPLTSLPNPGALTLSIDNEQPTVDFDLNRPYRIDHPDVTYAALGGPSGDFSIPTLEELGIPASDMTTPHRGGESLALESLEALLRDKAYIATFEKPKTAPTAFEPAATTLLSPHLHFGS